MDKLYCDLDGVIVDFDKEKQKIKFDNDDQMWKEIEKDPDWFAKLSPMADYLELWDYIKQYNPIILTALPRKSTKLNADSNKRDWVKRYLGDVPVITCYAVEKQKYAPGNILIDDTGRNIGQWIKQGGIGILHKNAKQTNKVLKEIL